MTRMILPLMIGLAMAASACAPDGFSLDQTIDHARVIAIASSPADVLPGEEVTFTAVTAGDLDGASVHTWEICAQTLGPDDQFACDPEAGGAIATGEGLQWVWTNPMTADELDAICAMIGQSVDINAAFVTCDDGLPATVRLTTALPTGDTQISLRPVILRWGDSATRRNANPAIDALSFNEASLVAFGQVEAVFPDEPTVLEAAVGAEHIERYQAGEGETDEVLSLAWYTTHGELELSRTYWTTGLEAADFYENELELSEADRAALADGEVLQLYLVLRDGRGGVDWAVYEAIARE